MDEILNNPEIMCLNAEVIRLARIIIKDGEASYKSPVPALRLLCRYHAIIAVHDLADTLRKLDRFPEVQAIKAEFSKRFGVEFPAI